MNASGAYPCLRLTLAVSRGDNLVEHAACRGAKLEEYVPPRGDNLVEHAACRPGGAAPT